MPRTLLTTEQLLASYYFDRMEARVRANPTANVQIMKIVDNIDLPEKAWRLLKGLHVAYAESESHSFALSCLIESNIIVAKMETIVDFLTKKGISTDDVTIIYLTNGTPYDTVVPLPVLLKLSKHAPKLQALFDDYGKLFNHWDGRH